MKSYHSFNHETDEGYLLLAKAIVEQAVIDLKDCVEKRRAGKETLESKRMMSDVLRFFNSDYYSLLTDVDARVILKEVIVDGTEV